VAITGFGRIARALASLLAAMGARVTVAARKEKDLATARRLGYGTVSLSESGAASALGQGYAAVFNTVPACLFNEECLRAFDRTTLLIDLASAPGGVDAEAAARLGIRVIFALSLPGKYAPETAGEIIAETVLEEMKRREGE
jgi:dipicolinate synthase subunit A